MVTGTTTTTTTTAQMSLLQESLHETEIDNSTMSQLPFHEPLKAPKPTAEFSPTACLFCNSHSASLGANYQHMQKRHGLFIPDQDNLLVEMEVFLEYLHLIIFEDMECLYCHTSRRTVQAVQQHMMGTGHCKFDISHEDSEFLDFYDYESENSESEVEETQLELRGHSISTSPVQVDGSSMRLPSGRIVSNRSTPAPRHPSRKPLKPPASRHTSHLSMVEQSTASEPSEATNEPSSPKPRPSSKALEKQERRAATLAVQLSNMRTNDQRALAHLPMSEQRVVLAQALRAEARSDRSQRHFRGHMDSLGNLNSKARWISDVPGGPKHKNRFLAP